MITDNLKKLNTTDVYSLALFALYKMRDIPEYRTLSELVYSMDQGSFIRICQYLGGKTITIPTLDELEVVLYALLVYDDVKSGKSFTDCVDSLPITESEREKVEKLYADLSEVLEDYEFFAR